MAKILRNRYRERMARKLRTFQTSLGFFDLAVAAPSRKAALEAWGAGSNLFHQGIAKETGDPEVVKATLARPGVVLKRPAGSSGRFSEHAELPSQSAADNAGRKPKGAPKHRRTRSMPQAKRPSPGPADKVGRKAAADDGKLQARREAERRRTDAARARVRARGRTRRSRKRRPRSKPRSSSMMPGPPRSRRSALRSWRGRRRRTIDGRSRGPR